MLLQLFFQRSILFVLSLWLYPTLSLAQTPSLQSGDILFRSPSSEPISQAINQVTKSKPENNFTHMGIAHQQDHKWYVLHADVDSGSAMIPLNEFLKPKSNHQTIAFRVLNLSSVEQQIAIAKAKSLLGKPYNHSYLPNDTSYYCSDFVYHSFRHLNLFRLNPMTFKNPNSGKFNSYWKKHYRSLKMEIPEGKLGCNPNDMSKNLRLKRLGILTLSKNGEISLKVPKTKK